MLGAPNTEVSKLSEARMKTTFELPFTRKHTDRVQPKTALQSLGPRLSPLGKRDEASGQR